MMRIINLKLVIGIVMCFLPLDVSSKLNCPIFPAGDPWNVPVSHWPVHNMSSTYIKSIGGDMYLHPIFGTVYDGQPNGIPFQVITKPTDQYVPVKLQYEPDSSGGPYVLTKNTPIEGCFSNETLTCSVNGDRHAIVLDDTNCVLYEIYHSYAKDNGTWWEAASGVVWDLKLLSGARTYGRKLCWTSADAAGLPIFPGLVRYDEVAEATKLVHHAFRFTVPKTQKAFIFPATHYASLSSDDALPPMGLRVRIKASFDCAQFSAFPQIICNTIKEYGMIIADNGGAWGLAGAPDMRWNNNQLGELHKVKGSDMEVVYSGELIKSCD